MRPIGWGARSGAGQVLHLVVREQPKRLLKPRRTPLPVSGRGIEGAPTLVVEILSPSTTLIDRSTKRQLYRRHGVPYYWIVDHEARAIEAYQLSAGDYQLVTRASGPSAVSLPPFPDLSLVPASLWP